MEITEVDRRILNELQQDGKASFREIAKKAKCSAVTAMKKIHNMEKEGIIRRYSAVLDYEKLGFDVSIILDVRVSKGKLFNVEKKISAHPNVMLVYDNTGQFDVTVVARFHTRAAMDNFLKRLQGYDFVERTETRLILNTMKEGGIEV
ncbi:MAG: Lrp/AsnC family transcriptional regulator [Candidatus Micrarchaeota archaeon]